MFSLFSFVYCVLFVFIFVIVSSFVGVFCLCFVCVSILLCFCFVVLFLFSVYKGFQTPKSLGQASTSATPMSGTKCARSATRMSGNKSAHAYLQLRQQIKMNASNMFTQISCNEMIKNNDKKTQTHARTQLGIEIEIEIKAMKKRQQRHHQTAPLCALPTSLGFTRRNQLRLYEISRVAPI